MIKYTLAETVIIFSRIMQIDPLDVGRLKFLKECGDVDMTNVINTRILVELKKRLNDKS